MSNPLSNLARSLNPASSVPTERAVLREIDESTKAPALFFLISGILWLLLGTIFAIIASIKMHTPGFLGQYEWLTFGNIRTAHLNSVIYGWASNSAFAVALWLMARLSRMRLRHPAIVLTAACVWNVGVTIGIAGILCGDSTGIEWLEIPTYATPILFVGYALIGVWAVIAPRPPRGPRLPARRWA
jgi:cytochrome c oxidase cbb3-type subunit 1